MASATRREDDGPDGVEFVREDDGTVTARDLETGLARGGETRAEALTQLAEVLTLEAGGGEPIADPDGFLRDIGVDSSIDDNELPDVMR
ncbi:type II toxin-antitoxin system HicB family antitoxin [Halorubrum sp. N11]|uniref:type II toxin-antitoxin system HicB family antitoxin n=1 Tax=Halorubrum sp. N11 TaxID=3402276 RepID=UPI003EB6B491